MLAGLCFCQLKARAARNHNLAVMDVMLQECLECQNARLVIDQRQHVGVERALHGGVFVERVQHAFGCGVAFEFDEDTHTLAVGLVAHFRDAVDLLVACEFRDLFHQFCFVDLVGKLGHDDTHAPALALFDDGTRAHNDTPASIDVGVADTLAPLDNTAGGEVRSAYNARQVLGGRFWIFNQVNDAVTYFVQIMRWDIGCHTNGNTRRAV